MSAKNKTIGYKVDIDVKRLGNMSIAGWSVRTSDSFLYPEEKDRLKAYEERCDDIAKEINNNRSILGKASVEEITEKVCSFCGGSWTEGESQTNYCCDADAEAYDAILKSMTDEELAKKIKSYKYTIDTAQEDMDRLSNILESRKNVSV